MRPMPCWSPRLAVACSAGWARSSSSSAPRASTSACGSSSASAQAIVSSTDASPAGFAALAERAVAMARVVPEDPYAGLADAPDGLVAVDLDLADAAEPTADALIARAAAAEEAALAVAGRDQFRGRRGRLRPLRRGRSWHAGTASPGEYARTSHSISATALAGAGHRDAAGLRLFQHRPPGRPGGRRPASAAAPGRRRWPGSTRPGRRPPACPVVYDPRVAASLLGPPGRRHQRRRGRPRHPLPAATSWASG